MDAIVEKLEVKNGEILVVREDLLPGGTKSRAAIPFVGKMKEYGCQKFNYASPFCGYAQIALAIACKKNQVECKIFAVSEKGQMSSYSKIAQDNEAQIELFDSLDSAEEHASKATGFKIPLGFNHSLYEAYFYKALKEQFEKIKPTNNVWLPIGSGTLLRSVRKCIKNKIIGVNVKVFPLLHKKIFDLKKLPNTIIIDTPEPFEDQAHDLPPIPSNLYYDAKLWKFIYNHAKNEDIWWKIGRAHV